MPRDDDVTIGPNYDPDRDQLLHAWDGTPLTREEIDRLADEADAGYDLEEFTRVSRGRPSLSGDTKESPQLRFRLPASLRARAQQRADREGKTLSQVTREALERHLA